MSVCPAGVFVAGLRAEADEAGDGRGCTSIAAVRDREARVFVRGRSPSFLSSTRPHLTFHPTLMDPHASDQAMQAARHGHDVT